MTLPAFFTKHKNTLQKATPFLWAGAIFFACLVCGVLVWYQYFTNISTSSQRNLLNDAYTTTTAGLEEGVPLTQEFETFSPIYEVGVYFERLSEGVSGTLTIQLLNLTTGELLLDTTGNIASVYYDAYTTFTLPEPVTSWDVINQYQLIITANYTTESGQLALKKSDVAVYGFSNLTENYVAADGAIALMVTYDVLGDTPTKGYFALCVLFALCAAGLCLLCFFGKGKFARSNPLLAFIVIFTIGIFYQFAMPAFSTPDELAHYDTAYYLTNTWFGITPETAGSNLVKRATDAQSTYVDYYTDAYTYRYIADHFFDAPDGMYVEETASLLGPYYLPYYLSAIGLAIGQILNWGGIVTTFFARTLNLLFFAAMAALSIKLVPFGKKIFAAVALLPISLHIAGSFSYDSCLLTLAFVVLALGIRLAYQEGPIKWLEVAAFALVCFLIAPLKMAYFPLTFIALFIPTKRFATVWKARLVRYGVPGLGILHFVARHYIAIFVQMSVNLEMESAVDYSTTVVQTSVSTGAVTEEIIGTYTISTLLSYPGITLNLIINTFFTDFTDYFTSMLGGTLGYQNLAEVNLNSLIVFSFAGLLLFAALKQKDERSLPAWQRWSIGLMSLAVLGILVLACFSWTLITYDTIWGFQGRYLLPVLGFAIYAMQPTNITTKNDCLPAILYAGFILNFFALLNIATVTLLRLT